MRKILKILTWIILIIMFSQIISLAIVTNNPNLEWLKWHLLLEILLIFLVPIFIVFTWMFLQERNNSND